MGADSSQKVKEYPNLPEMLPLLHKFCNNVKIHETVENSGIQFQGVLALNRDPTKISKEVVGHIKARNTGGKNYPFN